MGGPYLSSMAVSRKRLATLHGFGQNSLVAAGQFLISVTFPPFVAGGVSDGYTA